MKLIKTLIFDPGSLKMPQSVKVPNKSILIVGTAFFTILAMVLYVFDIYPWAWLFAADAVIGICLTAIKLTFYKDVP